MFHQLWLHTSITIHLLHTLLLTAAIITTCHLLDTSTKNGDLTYHLHTNTTTVRLLTSLQKTGPEVSLLPIPTLSIADHLLITNIIESTITIALLTHTDTRISASEVLRTRDRLMDPSISNGLITTTSIRITTKLSRISSKSPAKP